MTYIKSQSIVEIQDDFTSLNLKLDKLSRLIDLAEENVDQYNGEFILRCRLDEWSEVRGELNKISIELNNRGVRG